MSILYTYNPKNLDESELIQLAAFQLGWKWTDSSQTFKRPVQTDTLCFTADSRTISYLTVPTPYKIGEQPFEDLKDLLKFLRCAEYRKAINGVNLLADGTVETKDAILTRNMFDEIVAARQELIEKFENSQKL